MSDLIAAAAGRRAVTVTQSMRRHRLVFVQLGRLFDPIRDELISAIPGTEVSIDHRDDWMAAGDDSPLLISDLERCAESTTNVLGDVREKVLAILDAGRSVCMFSRSPRVSFRLVPGSSVLEDAALVTLPTLDTEEIAIEEGVRAPAGWRLPSVAFGTDLTAEMLTESLSELGHGLVSALDHAIYEVDPKGASGLQFLTPRELEGLRGAGIVFTDGGEEPKFTAPSSIKLLKEALSEHVSKSVAPADRLPEVVAGLWLIERTLRSAVRTAAIAEYGGAWRSSCIGGMKSEVLKRAQLDTSVAASSVEDLRDPLEWLTLSELLDIVRGPKFDQLGVEPAIWRKLQEQLVPVRNRLAHVRLLKGNDHETVQMWSSTITARLR